MSELKENRNIANDEIDLRQLFTAIGDFFSSIGKSVVNGVVSLRRQTLKNRWLILGLALIVGLLGLIYFNLSKPVYSTSMLVNSEYFNSRIMTNAIDKLDALSKEAGKEGLARTLNVTQEVADNVVGFEVEPFVSEEDRIESEVLKQKLSELKLDESEINALTQRIEVENKNTFRIIIKVNKSDIINGLEPAIVQYLRGSSFISNRISNREQRLEEELEGLKTEKSKLDSLKKALINIYESSAKQDKAGSDNLFIGDQYSSNPVSLFEQSLSIQSRIKSVKTKIQLKDDFEVIDGLTVFRTPESAGLLKSIVVGMMIGVGIAYLIILLKGINAYLSRVEAERFADR